VADLLLDLAARLGHWAYALVFLVATLEASVFLGLVVPGETLTIAAGFLVSAGILELVPTILTAAAGATLGDSIGYELGRRLGRPWLVRYGRRFGFDERRLDRIDTLFVRHGGKAVVVARFVGFVRALAPFVAGAARMPYPRFLLFNVIGAWLWAIGLVTLGYVLGASWWIAERWVGRVGLIAAVVVLTVAWLSLRWARRQSA
jgi:membrane protein DedA with SNARE-associated domain